MDSAETRADGAAAWVFAALLFAAGLALMDRAVWMSTPLHSLGDNGDGLIVIAILEHWFHVVSGVAADWRSPGWFWPAKGGLGMTDSYLLLALPYCALRAVGFGPFGALTATAATLSASGYWGMIALTRALGARVAVGACAGFVFAFGALVTFKLGHLQTYTVMIAPWIGLGLWRAWRARTRAGMGLAAAAGLLFGLVTTTAPQTGWFLGFEAGLAALLLLVVRWPVRWPGRRRLVRTLAPRLGGFVLGTLVGAAPIPLIYAGSLGQRRSWPAVMFYLPQVRDVLDGPPGNLIWSAPLHWLGLDGDGGRPIAEVALGFTPVLAVSAVLALAVLLPLNRRRLGPHAADAVAAACLAVPVLAWLLTADYGGGVSPWHVVWAVVPGAATIRTPFRIQIVSLLFLLAGLAPVFSRALTLAARSRAAGWAGALSAVLALIVVEQLGPAAGTRDTWQTARWLLAARPPGFACRAFYVLPAAPGAEPWFEYQSDAMLLAEWLRMPTLNGNASWYPAGWDMLYPDRADYARHALDWIARNGIAGDVCGVDARRGRWVAGIGPLQLAAGEDGS